MAISLVLISSAALAQLDLGSYDAPTQVQEQPAALSQIHSPQTSKQQSINPQPLIFSEQQPYQAMSDAEVQIGTAVLQEQEPEQAALNFLSAGLQFPFRAIWHDSPVQKVSHLDKESQGSVSWDGSVGHYLEYGRILYNQSSNDRIKTRCALKSRADFDYRSDHNVIFDSGDELRLDLSILSLMALAECEQSIAQSWSGYFDFGLGAGMHINGTKAIRKTAEA